MDLKVWAPFTDFDKDWHFNLPRVIRETSQFRPSIDVVNTDGQIVLTAELPGIAPDAVDVTLEGDILTIMGEKSEEREVSEDDHYLHERTFGSFRRRIALPDGVTADDIAAEFDNGVLTVRVALPQRQTVEPSRIPVGTK